VHFGAGNRNDRVAAEMQCRTDQHGFQSCGRHVVSDERVGDVMGEVVHRTGRRKADGEVAVTPLILHEGLDAGLDDVKHG
jgi:hypothetical protein